MSIKVDELKGIDDEIRVKEINEERFFNYNKTYIEQLISNAGLTKKQVARKMGINTNVFYLKLSEQRTTKLYLCECIKLSNAVKVKLEDIFEPTQKLMGDALMDTMPLDEFKPYEKIRVDKDNIQEYMKNANVTLEDIASVFNLKTISVYEKLRGNTKMTIEEGLLLCHFLNATPYELYCLK